MNDVVSAREANQHFSELLRRVQAGERITVTSRGRPVAQMSGISEAPSPRREARKRSFIETLRSRAAQTIPRWSRADLYD
jgi:prevent-host-death family protein